MKVEKKKNLVIPILIVVIILAIIATDLFVMLIGNPEKTTHEFFEQLKKGNFDVASQYINNYNALFEDEEEQSEVSNETEENEISDILKNKENQKLLFSNIECDIKEINQEKDTASVKVEVTTKNFGTIMSNYIDKIIKLTMSTVVGGQNKTQEEINEEMKNYFLEEIKNESIDKITTTQEIHLIKKDRKWIIEVDDNLRRLIYPGVEEAINSIDSKINEIE